MDLPPTQANMVGKGTGCINALEAIPFCADDSWTLWYAPTIYANYFCCQGNLVGDMNGDCVSNNTQIPSSAKAFPVSNYYLVVYTKV